MKLYVPITKALVISACVLGSVLPAMAEQSLQSYHSWNTNNIVDWADEFEQTSHSTSVKTEMSVPKTSTEYALEKMPNMQNGPVVDWWDEFEYQASSKPASATTMTSKAMSPERALDEFWDWESLQSM
ncbi:MAG: hypothetical protein ACPGYT_07725 [Nitrospirales bacterium]